MSAVACSKKGSSTAPVVTPVTPIDDGTDDETRDELTRRCRIPVQYSNATTHEAALEALVQATVDKKERPTTMCVAAEASPLKGFDASFRVEYEDNYGLRWVTFRSRDLVYSDRRNGSFRLLYLDEYGYVELKTTRNSSTGKYSGQIRLANVSTEYSYLDKIEEFLDEIASTCNKSPVKCMNPIILADPISTQPPTESQILGYANDAFLGKNGAEPHTLGTVEFSSSMIEKLLF